LLISIGGRTQKFMDVLGIKDYPFTESELKTAYRTAIKKAHPDKQGSEEMAKVINGAYSELKNIALSDQKERKEGSVVDIEKEHDIFDLSEPCESCNGTGVDSYVQSVECNRCDKAIMSFFSRYREASGYKKLKCYPCKGTGVFKLRNGKEVECRKCHGEGTFIVKCKFCNGTGVIKRKVKVNCGQCNGTGRIEVKPMNPVIPKGAVL